MQAPGHAGSWGLRAAVAPEVQLGSPVTQRVQPSPASFSAVAFWAWGVGALVGASSWVSAPYVVPDGRDDSPAAVGAEDEGEPAPVDFVVMERAQQDAVLHVGRSAFTPGHSVVRFAPACWGSAPGGSAMSVADEDRPPLGGREEASPPAEVQDLSACALVCDADESVAHDLRRERRRDGLSGVFEVRHVLGPG